jgi:hypothetical protein
MSLIEEYNQHINSEGERRNPFIFDLLDNWGIETHEIEHRIIDQDHNFSNINNNNNNNNDNGGQIYEGLGEIPDNNIPAFENEEANKLFDLYQQEINVEENELEKELSEFSEESNKRNKAVVLT